MISPIPSPESSHQDSPKDPADYLRVVCIEDEVGVRDLLSEIVNSDPRLRVVGAFDDLSSARSCLTILKPEIVLLDIRLPGVGGIEAIPKIKGISPEAKILMLTISRESDDLFDALRAGADGYLLKQSSPQEIIRAVLAAADGNFPMSPWVATKIVDYFRATADAPSEKIEELLTSRQYEILEQLSKGLCPKEIADILKISVLTTRFHIRSMYKKLKVSSQTQAILKYMEMSSLRRFRVGSQETGRPPLPAR